VYGKMGEEDQKLIDEHLRRLGKDAVVVNLGCGPNVHALSNLARALWSCQFHSTLIFADLHAHAIGNQIWVPGPDKVEVVELNAATATRALGEERADLVLALGLFGDLSSTTTSEGTGKAAWPAVLRECLRLLKPLGDLIVSNSCDRQPREEFRAAVEEAGFVVTHQHDSPAIPGTEEKRGSGERRYLFVCQKPTQTNCTA
jgi:hypothetical protein